MQCNIRNYIPYKAYDCHAKLNSIYHFLIFICLFFCVRDVLGDVPQSDWQGHSTDIYFHGDWFLHQAETDTR